MGDMTEEEILAMTNYDDDAAALPPAPRRRLGRLAHGVLSILRQQEAGKEAARV